MRKLTSIAELNNLISQSDETVWRSMFSKSRPGILLDTSRRLVSFRPGRDICSHHWPFDCRC